VKNSLIYFSVIQIILLLVNSSCHEEETAELPTISTKTVSSIGTTTAVSGGEITSDGGSKVNARGVVWDIRSGPTLNTYAGLTLDGKGLGVYTSNLSGLKRNTTYYVRAYAVNGAGVTYGDEFSFMTLAEFATVITSDPVNITSTSVSCGGNVTDEGGAEVVERGVCWSISENPTTYNRQTSDGSGMGSFASQATRLTPGKTYYLRAFARNFIGTSYGNQVSFSTLPGQGEGEIIFNTALTYGTFTDIDGNSYKTIQIGTQTWMAENLRTTKYRNGDPIPEITDLNQWKNLTSGAYCNYNNEAEFAAIYGRLYNWFAVNDVRNLAPEGWHVATDNDWTTLISYLGGNNVAGGKLKEAGLTHWNSPNSGATNESGFSAVPGGLLLTGIFFSGIGDTAYWWSATPVDDSYASYWELIINYNWINRYGYQKKDGHSVRCVRD